jgi:hypothetical protein
VEAALEVVQPGGLVSVVVYTGHEGAAEEHAAVQTLVRGLTPTYWTCLESQLLNRPSSPVLMLVWRRADLLPPHGRW